MRPQEARSCARDLSLLFPGAKVWRQAISRGVKRGNEWQVWVQRPQGPVYFDNWETWATLRDKYVGLIAERKAAQKSVREVTA